VSERKSPVRRGRWLLRTLVALVVIGALGGLVVWRFIEGRGEAALEAERERPVKAPLRVSLDGRGEPVVTLDTETRKQGGVEVITPQGSHTRMRSVPMERCLISISWSRWTTIM
jgi:hypothetical protein